MIKFSQYESKFGSILDKIDFEEILLRIDESRKVKDWDKPSGASWYMDYPYSIQGTSATISSSVWV
jgi:hypothetical protein